MDILERMERRIVADFPNITADELSARLSLAQDMIQLDQLKNDTFRKELYEFGSRRYID